MKKLKWTAALLLALGFTLTFAACTENGGGTDGDKDPDQGTDITDPSGPENPGGDEPQTPAVDPSELGALSRVWKSFDGDVLDLTAGTLDSDLFGSFSLLSVTGENADMEITCKAGNTNYVLSLNDDGVLEMKREGLSSATLTFYAQADEFAGAWKTSDAWSHTYYTISPDMSGEGYAWVYLQRESDEEIDRGYAVTRLKFGADGAYVEFGADSGYGYDTFTVYPGEEGLLCDDGWDEFQFLPYLGGFNEELVYLDEDGNELTFGEGDSEIVYNGTKTAFELTATEKGSGLQFSAGNQDYLFQLRADGIYLVTAEDALNLAAYDSEAIKGVWSDSRGQNVFAVTASDKVRFNDEEHDLDAYARNGLIEYAFTAGGKNYTLQIVPEAGVVFEMSENGVFADYYVLNEAKELFFDSFTNKVAEFTVNSDYSVVFADSDSVDGTFTYLPEMGVIAFQFNMKYNAGSGASTYWVSMVNVDPEGAYWLLTGSGEDLEYFISVFTNEYESAFQAKFAEYLEGGDDFYTTGGTAPTTLSLDFEAGEITISGVEDDEPYEDVFTDYEYSYELPEDGFGGGYPEIMFLVGPAEIEENRYLVVFYTIRLFDLGVQVAETYVIIDSAEGTYYAIDPQYSFFISDAVYRSHLNKTFVYHGEVNDEYVSIGSDGTLTIDTTDLTDSDASLEAVEYDYVLQRYRSYDNQEIVAFVFMGAVYLNVWNGEYASIMDLYYAPAEYQAFVGTYHNGKDVVELTARGQVLVNGEATELKGSLVTADSSVTATYLLNETEYTAVFTEAGVTVTPAEGSGKDYTAFKYTPYKFVGTYTLGDVTVTVTSVTIGLNTAPTLVARVEGTSVDVQTLALDEEGRQVLTLEGSYWVLVPKFDEIEYKITLTLDGNKILLSDGTADAEADVNEWSFKNFVLNETESNEQYTLTCLAKEGGKLPIYLLKNGDEEAVSSSTYTVSIDGEGNQTLTLSCGSESVTIKVSAGGETTVTLPEASGGDIPLPPPPPPLP